MARGKTKSKERVSVGNHFTDYDIYLFKQGLHTRLFDKLGAHLA